MLLNQIDDVMYFPLLVVVMAIAGLYFTIKTRGGADQAVS